MPLPTKLKIGAHQVTVKYPDVTSNKNCGEWDPFKNQIEIDNKQPISQQEVTLIHEILHAINICMEEREVESLAQQLYQVLIDNNLTFTGK